MDQIDKIYNKLEDIQRYSGYGGLVLIIIITILMFCLYYYLKSYVSYWGKETLKKELEKYKSELNTELALTVVEKLTDVNKEIAVLKSYLNTTAQKELAFHTETLIMMKEVYDSFVSLIQDSSNSSQGGINMWDGEEIRIRVAFLNNLFTASKFKLTKLKLYLDDNELYSCIDKLILSLLDGPFHHTKNYLLKKRLWLSTFNTLPLADKEVELEQQKEVDRIYNETLIKYRSEHIALIEEFHSIFRRKYYEKIKNEA